MFTVLPERRHERRRFESQKPMEKESVTSSRNTGDKNHEQPGSQDEPQQPSDAFNGAGPGVAMLAGTYMQARYEIRRV